MDKQDQLMERLAAPENLLSAWQAVRGNIPSYRRQRSSGPDGVSLAEFERDLQVQLSALRHMLMKGRYEPQPPGLFNIKKRNGGTRQIALLNVSDRVAQRAAQQVIEPLYEPGFLPCSFGFRPGRSTQDAIYCVRRLRQRGYSWIVDGDIASCFDSLDHRLLMQKVSKRIGDGRVMDLLQKWLEIGMLEHGLPADKPNWLAQGWEKASGALKYGLDQTWEAVTGAGRVDPYAEAAYFTPGFSGAEYRPLENSEWGEDEEGDYDFRYRPQKSEVQKSAMQQIAAGGLMIGSGWARRGLSKTGPAALAALKSTAGRQMLKQGLLAGGTVVGAAAGLALTAYFVYRQVAPDRVGVMQGSPLSPLLANIYLHTFDLSLTRQGFRLIRFADDWVILCPDQENAELAYNQSVIALNRIHLKVNSEKTHILSPAEQLEWLGEIIA